MPENNTYSEEIRTFRDATGFVTQMFGDDYADVSDYMINLVGQETLYGTLKSQMYDDGTPVSITPYQIDAIAFQDFLQRSSNPKGAASKRVDIINESFSNMGYKDFDIRDIASVDSLVTKDPITGEESKLFKYKDLKQEWLDNPYITTSLARTIMASDTTTIPEDIEGQAEVWKKTWNKSGRGDPKEFIEKNRIYRENTSVEDNVMDMLRDQDEDPFKIQQTDFTEPAISTRVE